MKGSNRSHFNKYVYIALGSNVGNRKKHLGWAVMYLSRYVRIVAASNIMESQPWGYKNQKKFLNQVLKVSCNIKPKELLKVCKDIERKLRRIKKFKWGPRTVDVDIIAYKNIITKTKELYLPHRWAKQRDFVVEPLRELDALDVLNS